MVSRSAAALVAVGATVVAVGVGICIETRSDGAGGAPGRGPSATRSEITVQPAPARRVGAVRPERPTEVRLPSGRAVPVRAVGTRRDGVLDVPSNIRAAGWWEGGSRLGDPFGSVLIAGHVDSVTQGLGPYAELLSLRGGERVRVRSSHLDQVFVVRSLDLVPQGRLDRDDRIYSVAGRHRLTLVTCAPPYDRDRGGYQNLAVVTADPVGPPRTGAS